jgi:S1-C subfamily serine protease
MSSASARILAQVSAETAQLVATVSPGIVALHLRHGGHVSGILWASDTIIASEQSLAKGSEVAATLPGGAKARLSIAARDPSTNLTILRPEVPAEPGPSFQKADAGPVGTIVLMVGADGLGAATARLGMVHTLGPAWQSLAGGHIDRLIRLDFRLGSADEGGAIVDAEGNLVGMAAAGPRGRTLVIPATTIERVLQTFRSTGRIARGWLGLGLHPVALPDEVKPEAGTETALMVVRLEPGSPAEQAGLQLGDILIGIGDQPAADPRSVLARLGPEAVNSKLVLKFVRAGHIGSVEATIGERPQS